MLVTHINTEYLYEIYKHFPLLRLWTAQPGVDTLNSNICVKFPQPVCCA